MQNTGSEYELAEFPHSIENQPQLTKDEEIERAKFYMNLKSLRMSEDAEIIVLQLYIDSNVINGAIAGGFMPIYDCMTFFNEHFPNYNPKEFIREYTDRTLITDAMLNPEKYGHKELEIEDVFDLDEEEAAEYQRTKRLEFTAN